MGCGGSTDSGAVNMKSFQIMRTVGEGGFGKVKIAKLKKDKTGEMLALKIMDKRKLMQNKHALATAWAERDVLINTKSPYLLHLRYSFQSAKELMFCLPYMPGGDVRYYLLTQGKMDNPTAQFYGAQTLLAMEEMHMHKFLYRDLKPENLLLDALGNICLSDFGLAHRFKEGEEEKCNLEAGTAGYMSPEMIKGGGYSYPTDVFSYGILICEFITNKTPFDNEAEVTNPNEVSLPFSGPSCDFAKGCLLKDPAKRSGPWSEMKKHAFFEGFDWDKCAKRELPTPFKPKTDQVNCTKDAELEDMFFDDSGSLPKLTSEQQKQFEGFEFNGDTPVTPVAP